MLARIPCGSVKNGQREYFTHSSELIADFAIDFIDKHQHKPFFLKYLGRLSAWPVLPTEEQLAVYDDLTVDAENILLSVRLPVAISSKAKDLMRK